MLLAELRDFLTLGSYPGNQSQNGSFPQQNSLGEALLTVHFAFVYLGNQPRYVGWYPIHLTSFLWEALIMACFVCISKARGLLRGLLYLHVNEIPNIS